MPPDALVLAVSGACSAGDSLNPVSFERHRRYGWRRFDSYEFVQQYPLVPIVLGEHEQVAACLPILFLKTANGLDPVALTRVGDHCGLVAPNGAWRGTYIPSFLRSHPFQTRRVTGGKFELMVDEASVFVTESSEGEPLFEPDGSLTPNLKDLVAFFQERAQAEEKTARAMAAAERTAVLRPLSKVDELALVDGSLFEVDAEALSGLSRNDLSALHRSGALSLLYTAMVAQHHIPFLKHAESQIGNLGKSAPAATPAIDDDLSGFFDALATSSKRESQ